MFETLFTYPSARRRHREGPLSAERAAYLIKLADNGMARGTILRLSSYCLCIAIALQRWPPDRCLDEAEVELLAEEWAAQRAKAGRASSPRWPKVQFRFAATNFLQHLGRLRSSPAAEPGQYGAQLDDFIAAQQEGRWESEATCHSARWQITRFLDYLEQRGVALAAVTAADIDAFFEYMAQRWSRSSLRMSAKMLRAWFGYCERRSWARAGLADAILSPRVYRQEGLPLGPTWDAVGRVLAETGAEDPASLRDHAIILLLSVYGLRSGTVRRLRLADIDWAHDHIRFIRSKSRREETAPLEPRVGNAIARYLREGRPSSDTRIVFLTLRAPHRPLSAGGLYNVVKSRLAKQGLPRRGCGPHGLRHAYARHLVESGRSFKEVGDHLGHRSPDATRIYAKVDLTSLHKVAFDDLGGLA
ncbi:MAG: tyrosine-type recombinase/integrase [Thermoguttaceae bacterium]|jgi:site-specific recombinase XerD|nr:tyrosine-type recombinase/integrase [Thermoguttaceae bacterium]